MTDLGDLLLYVTAFLGAFLAATWLALVFWTYRDIRSRSDDLFVHVLATVVVLLLGPAGLLVYVILRPPLTLDGVYQKTLEEEALLADIEDRTLCPGCGHVIHQEWQICPSCHTRLRKNCANCNRLLELSWQICPYCGTAANEGPVPAPRRASSGFEVDDDRDPS